MRILPFASAAPLAALVAILASLARGGVCHRASGGREEDPLKCERDPHCKNDQRPFDCSAQCAGRSFVCGSMQLRFRSRRGLERRAELVLSA